MHRRSQHPGARRDELAEEAPAAAGQLGRPAGLGHGGARHDQRLPRLHARGGAAHDDRLGVLLHARVDHPGRQEAHGHRARADPHESAHRAPSRLFDSIWSYIKRSTATIVRIYAMYEPLKVFSYIGATIFLRRRSRWSCASCTTTSRHRPRARAVADPLGGADDRRLPGPAHRAGGRRDLRQPQAARGPALSRALDRARRSALAPIAAGTAASRTGSRRWPTPSTTSVIVPAFNEGAAIAAVVAALRAGGALARDHRRRRWVDRRHGRRGRGPPGAIVVRHPYNKGNGAAVKTGIRRATGEYVLIVDGDGQHQPGDAAAPGRAARRVRPRRRRAIGGDAGDGRAARRQCRAELARELPDRARDSRSDVGLPRRAPGVPAASSSTCCPTASRRRRRRRWPSSRRATTWRSSRSKPSSASASRRSSWRATARSSS